MINSTDGMKELWGNILICAIKDAVSIRPRTSDSYNEWRLERDKSYNWIADNSKDFQEVCIHAGIDSNFIRSHFLAGKFTSETFKKQRLRRAASSKL